MSVQQAGLEKIVTSAKCDIITDNVYRYATNKKYYECAADVFSQVDKLLNGQKIAEPMKYICNSILSIMLSLFVTYGLFILCSRNGKASDKEIVNECDSSLKYSPVVVTKIGTHIVYSPISDSSSSDGSFGGSSGGGRRRRRILWKRRKPWFLTNKMYRFYLVAS